MIRPPRPRKLVVAALALALAGPAAAQAPKPPLAPDAAAEIERLRRDAERLARDAAREAADRARAAQDDAFRGLVLAQAALDRDLDFDLDAPSFAFIGREFGSTRDIVKNAPYQADAINESIQTLGDGNRIVRRTTTKVARDGYGRTRQEKPGGTVYLFDPIDDRSFALDPQRKTAMRIPRAPLAPLPPLPPMPPSPPEAIAPPTPPAPPSGAPMSGVAPPAPVPGAERVVVRRTADGKAVEVGPVRAPGPVRPPGPARTPGPVHPPGPPAGEDRETLEDVRIEVVRIGRDGPGADARAPLPPLALPLLPRGQGETKALGTRDFDGIKADGRMTTHTIPAGEIGNEKPIVVTSERWFSPELHVVVYAKNSDPRTGDTIYRLANLKRGEPPAEAFRVPADYKMRRP